MSYPATPIPSPDPPVLDPIVSLAQIKAFLSVPHDDDDEFFTTAAQIVTAEIEGATRCRFTGAIEKVRRIDGGFTGLILPDVPAVEITTIEDKSSGAYTDPDDTYLDAETGVLYLNSGALWDAGRGRWCVTYRAGHDDPPADLQGAALTLIAARYERRDLSQTSVTQGGLATAYGDAWGADVERVINRYQDRAV
jgi:hypothetical protein